MRSSSIVGLSLYPQLSTRLLGSSVAALSQAAGPARLSVVDRYGEHAGYLDAVKKTIARGLERFPSSERDAVVLVFSALGIDRQAVEQGDPYLSQVRATVKALAGSYPNPHRLAVHGPNAHGPQVVDVVRKLGQERVGGALVVPLGSAVDELSVVVDLELELREVAKEAGLGQLQRAPSVAEEPAFADALAAAVREHLERQAALGLGL